MTALSRFWWLGLLVAVGFFSIAASGCGLSGGNGGEEAPAERDSARQDTFETFSSASKGYSISYPSHWSVREDSVPFGPNQADGFFAAEPKSGYTTKVAVLCRPLKIGLNTAAYLAVILGEFEEVGLQVSLSDETVQVAGEASQMLTYSSDKGGEPHEVAQVFLSKVRVAGQTVRGGDCGWSLTLTTAPRLLQEYLPTFLTMVESFSLSQPAAYLDGEANSSQPTQQVRNAYPPSVVQNFMDACMFTGGGQAYCSCTLEEIQGRYSLEEYTTLEIRMLNTGQFPEELAGVMAKCVQ